MNWDDKGYLLSKNRYNENSIIAEVFTENYGKISGIIFGGTSKKIKNYLQIGNKIHVNYNSKSLNRIGYFKVEIVKATTPIYFDNSIKLCCITSAMHLVKLLTDDIDFRIHRYSKCISKSTHNFLSWLKDDYKKKLRAYLRENFDEIFEKLPKV